MAYTPINWQTGDTITAVKLNKMDNGWSVESTQLFSETVTTTVVEGGHAASGSLEFVQTGESPQTLAIRFDGTDYVCENRGIGGYGSTTEDFSDGVPFFLLFGPSRTTLFTPTAGTYTVSASELDTQISDYFKTAVSNCVDIPDTPNILSVGAVDLITDKTWDEIDQVVKKGGICVLEGYGLILTTWYGSGNRYYMAVANNYSGKFDPYIWRTSGTSADGYLSPYKRNSEIT